MSSRAPVLVRVVLDTNVLVSGLIGEHGPPRQLIDAWLEGRYTLLTSLYQAAELNHVLSYPRIASRLRLEESELSLILAALLSEAEVTPSLLELPGVTRDPKDDPLVACALEGNADYLVSGDRDLLDLGEYGEIQIVSPHQFAGILNL
jgi:putative PIN family toxin of toxin-antitoxin system